MASLPGEIRPGPDELADDCLAKVMIIKES